MTEALQKETPGCFSGQVRQRHGEAIDVLKEAGQEFLVGGRWTCPHQLDFFFNECLAGEPCGISLLESSTEG